GHGELQVVDHLVGRVVEPGQRGHGVAGHPDVLRPWWEGQLELGVVPFGARHGRVAHSAATAASTDGWMSNTRFSPVMSKIFRILSWVVTMDREPSFSRTRFSPPTS